LMFEDRQSESCLLIHRNGLRRNPFQSTLSCFLDHKSLQARLVPVIRPTEWKSRIKMDAGYRNASVNVRGLGIDVLGLCIKFNFTENAQERERVKEREFYSARTNSVVVISTIERERKMIKVQQNF
jgi:hypothetical protein